MKRTDNNGNEIPIKPVTPYIVLMYPNNTTCRIEGNSEIIKQITNRLDGLVIDYIPNE